MDVTYPCDSSYDGEEDTGDGTDDCFDGTAYG